MRKLTVISLVALVALAAAPPAAQAARSCAAFKGRTLVSNSQMKIVEQSRSFGSRLVACDRRNGRGRLLGRTTSKRPLAGGLTETTRLLAGSGRYAAVRRQSTNEFGGGETAQVVDVRTARFYYVARWTFNDSVLPGPAPRGEVVRSLRLSADGRSAAVVAVGTDTPTFSQTSTAVLGFAPNRSFRVLGTAAPKAISAGSLKLIRGVARWSQAGAVRTGALP